MTKFLNLKDGTLSVNTYRFPDALVTDFLDIKKAWENETGECLTTNVQEDLQLSGFTVTTDSAPLTASA